MSRAATAGFLSIMFVAGFICFRVAQPQRLVQGAIDSPAELTTAAGMSVLVDALTPAPTAIPTTRPTNTPKPPTATPDPTYVGQASPPSGYYVVPAWTETPPVAVTSELQIPPCITVTPTKFAAQGCNVP